MIKEEGWGREKQIDIRPFCFNFGNRKFENEKRNLLKYLSNILC